MIVSISIPVLPKAKQKITNRPIDSGIVPWTADRASGPGQHRFFANPPKQAGTGDTIEREPSLTPITMLRVWTDQQRLNMVTSWLRGPVRDRYRSLNRIAHPLPFAPSGLKGPVSRDGTGNDQKQ